MRIWAYGDDINTDMLFPGKYTYTCAKPEVGSRQAVPRFCIL